MDDNEGRVILTIALLAFVAVLSVTIFGLVEILVEVGRAIGGLWR